MSLQFFVKRDGRAFDGFGTDWVWVERALAKTAGPFPMLRSIDPYQLRTLSHDDVAELLVECERLIAQTGGKAAQTLNRLSELTRTVLASPGAELHLAGD